MSWPFCPICGKILNAPENDIVKCSFCMFSANFDTMNAAEIVTRSAPKAKASWLVDIEQQHGIHDGTGGTTGGREVTHATIEEPCPRCNHPELYFYTMQLRSVDEGSTVFYECPQCSYKFSQNN